MLVFCSDVHCRAASVFVLPVLRSRLPQLLILNISFSFITILILPKQYSLSTATLGHIPSHSHNMCWRLQAVVHTFLVSYFRVYLKCAYKLLQMSPQRSVPMIYGVTLMYSPKLFLNLNRWETGCVELFIYFLKHYLSIRTWMSSPFDCAEQSR